jgi:WD40 repeat protein
MLDTGGHMAKIQDITFTPDGRQLSASDNKTIRVWNGATGAFNRILASHG